VVTLSAFKQERRSEKCHGIGSWTPKLAPFDVIWIRRRRAMLKSRLFQAGPTSSSKGRTWKSRNRLEALDFLIF
jgi:hypothetical protein